MPEGYYRSGTAADALGISPYHLRRLFEAGLIRAQMSPSGQLQVAVSEVRRLKIEGVPAVPAGLRNVEEDSEPGDRWVPEEPEPFSSRRSTESSAVAESADAVAITRNQLKKRELDLELEELEDSFRERERQSAAQNAERASATRQRRDRELEALRERWWRERCRRYALWRLPQDAQLEVRLNLPEVMDELLSKTDRHQAWRVTRSLIDAAVAQLLGPYRRGKEIDCRIKEAVDGLPRKVKDCHQPSDWPLRAAAAARRAVRELPVDASMEEIELAVRQAVESVVHEIGKQQA